MGRGSETQFQVGGKLNKITGKKLRKICTTFILYSDLTGREICKSAQLDNIYTCSSYPIILLYKSATFLHINSARQMSYSPNPEFAQSCMKKQILCGFL